MFPDNTLTPKEAIRLCALGILAQRDMRYSTLANEVRHFVSHVLGPSLDLMGTSIELLKYEGLIEPVRGVGMEDDAELSLTDKGREELHVLLTAKLRNGGAELNKLLTALKFRFLHLLDPRDRRAQADLLIDTFENEAASLVELRVHHAADGGYLSRWLDHEIAALNDRIAWLNALRDDLAEPAQP